MKKKIAIFAAAVLSVSMLSACGKDTAYLKGIDASKYVTLGEYKGIEVTEKAPEVTDDVVDYYINNYILASMAVTTEVTDRTVVEDGDTVNIDFTGYRDGTPFENGSAQGASLTIGSGSYIPGFEDGLIGANVGDTVTLDLTFPDDYELNPDMAGVEVSFEVTVNGISIVEIPELTDEIVQGIGIGECSTPDELRKYLYESLYNNAMDSYNDAVRSDIINATMANCIFKDPPQKMVDRYYDMIVEGMTTQASAYGMDLETFMYNYYYMTESDYMEAFTENATTSAQQYIMFQAIADAEGLNISEEELSKAMEENASEFGYESIEAFKEQVEEEEFREYIMAETVMDFLIENAVFTNSQVEKGD